MINNVRNGDCFFLLIFIEISTEAGVVSNADVAYYLSNYANQKES